MKKMYLVLALSLGLMWILPAQNTLISWKLNSSALSLPTPYTNALRGLAFERGNGLSKLTFSATYVQAHNWATEWKEEAEVDFFEFGFRAEPGKTITLTSLEFKEKRSSDGPRTAQLRYSRDDFKTSTILTTLNLPDSINLRTHHIPLNLVTDSRENLTFRLYAFDSESEGGSWAIRSETLNLKGTVATNCPGLNSATQLRVLQTTQTSIEVEIAGGSTHKLLLASPLNDPITYPFDGKAYTGDLHYGNGDAIAGSSTYVLRITNANQEVVSVTGLTPGANYQLAVFDYDQSTLCYADQPGIVAAMTLCPPTANSVQGFRYSALDSEVGVDWLGPNCFDQYLLVGAKHPFTGIPTTTNLVGAADFGTGSQVAGLGSDVFALYYGNQRSSEVVKNVENGTTYYFALYTLYNGQWSAGEFFSATPEASCVPGTKERIFFNEGHYLNAGVDQDEGVEIAGAAGIDLSNYRINIYRVPPGPTIVLVPDREILLTGVIDDEGAGFGAVWFPIPDLPDSHGLMTLTNMVTGELVFAVFNSGPNRLLMLSGGSIQNLPFQRAVGGEGERDTDPPGLSVQFVGTELCPLDMTWNKLPHTRGYLNIAQRVLPVELLSLAAERKGDQARIYWSTANEENSDYFLLEHSTDGRSFRPLAEVKAAGSSSFRLDYEYHHLKPVAGQNYYRLRQVDFDGTTYDHGVVRVRFDELGGEKWTIAPNPVLDQTTVQWSGTAQELLLSDSQGRILRRIVLNPQAEGGSQSLQLGDLSAGMYFLRLLYEGQVEARSLLKQ